MIPDTIRSNLAYVHKIKDRSDPVAFVGRRAELDFLQEVVDLVRAAPATGKGKPKGTLRLSHGVPGTGKTALKAEFMRQIMGRSEPLAPEFLAQDAGHPGATPAAPPVLCVELDSSHLALAPLSLVQRLTHTVIESQAAWQLAQTPKALKAKVDLSTAMDAVSRFLFRGATVRELHEKAHGLKPDTPLVDCLNHYANNVWQPGTTIVLIIDEAQNLKTTNENTKDNMQRLFEGNHIARLPVLCFGLSNAGKVLKQLGLSRPTGQSDQTIGCLNPGEGRQAIVETMRKVGLSTEIKEWRDYLLSIGMTEAKWDAWSKKTADVLAKQAADFPQHVAAAHIALCGNLLKDENSPFDQTRRNNIAAAHQTLKREYYQVCLGSPNLISKHHVALGAIADMFRRTNGAPIEREHAERLIALNARPPASAPNGEEVLTAAIDKGLMECDPGDADLILPPLIPSLQTHLENHFAAACRRGAPNALRMRNALVTMAPEPATPEPSDPEPAADENPDSTLDP